MTEETLGNIQQVWDWIKECRDRSITSLSEYTKKTLIESRAYIEDSIAHEDGITPIMKFCNHMFGGFVFTAIGMNNLASNGRTVRDMASMISTEDFHEFVDLIKDKFGGKNVRISAALEANEIKDAQDRVEKSVAGASASKEDDKKNVRAEEVKLDAGLFQGRVVEITISDGKNKIPFYFYVQIIPYVTPSNVMEQFITSNYQPDRSSRWAKFKAGEIKFWRDFVFECDLVEKRKKALKADKEGILREMEDRKMNQIRKAAIAMSPTASQNHNSASSIIVVSRRSLDSMMKDRGLDYRRYDVRQKIMKTTMSTLLVVFDPNYNTVDIYMNGIQNAGHYSIDQLKDSVSKKDKDAVDFKTLMTLLSSGSMPRL